MAVVALLALFGADEDLLDLADPAIRRLPIQGLTVGLLRHRSILIEGDDAEEKQHETGCGYTSSDQHASNPHRT